MMYYTRAQQKERNPFGNAIPRILYLVSTRWIQKDLQFLQHYYCYEREFAWIMIDIIGDF
jgi:hypothetical protein